MLVLERVTVWRDGKAVVRDATLQAGGSGPLWITGPGGAGKSSLLAAMASDPLDGRIAMDGRCTLRDRDLRALDGAIVFVAQQGCTGDSSRSDAFAPQDARDGDALRSWRAERHFGAVMHALSRDGAIYLVDEPTAGLDDAQARIVRERLRQVAASAAVVGVTHNRQDCLAMEGTTALLVGGTIQEVAASAQFFDKPATEAGRVYVETGNCGIAATAPARASGNGVWWAVPGLLCGLSRPGLVSDVTATCRELADGGVRRLLCLEERCEYPTGPLRELGISLHRFAMPDMAPPSFSQAVDICRLAEPAIRANEGVAAHCRGGLGRTGTVIAAILVWFGDSVDLAVARVRGTQPRAIQSDAQLRFLHEFADRIRGWH